MDLGVPFTATTRTPTVMDENTSPQFTLFTACASTFKYVNCAPFCLAPAGVPQWNEFNLILIRHCQHFNFYYSFITFLLKCTPCNIWENSQVPTPRFASQLLWVTADDRFRPKHVAFWERKSVMCGAVACTCMSVGPVTELPRNRWWVPDKRKTSFYRFVQGVLPRG